MKKILLITLGNLLYAFASAYFILPQGLITGGTTGLGIFFNHICGLPITVFIYLFNAAMFLLGLAVLGKRFALSTLLSSIEYPFLLSLMQLLYRVTGSLTQDLLLSALYGGICIGLSIGLIIQQGASSGGMDIPPLVLEKLTGFPVSVSLNLFDLLILLLQAFTTDLNSIMHGILLVITYTVVLDRALVYGRQQVELRIISPKWKEINEAVLSEFDRGSTITPVIGGYTGESYRQITTVVSKRELFGVQQKVQSIDKNAFMTIANVRDVRGHGFSLRKVYKQ